MPYGTPTDPVAATVITVAYAVANILNPIRWLRQMTGNADPPGSDYVVRSTSTTATVWSKVTTDLLDTAAVTNTKILAGTIDASTRLAEGSVTESRLAVGNDPSTSGFLGWTGSLFQWRTVQDADIANAAILYRQFNATNSPGDTQYPAWNNAAGKWTFTTPAAAVSGVPSGLVAMVTNAAAIPSGWTRESGLDGRVPVGDGTTAGQTFTAENNYGSSWVHQHHMNNHTHTAPGHTHSGSDLGISGNTSGPSGTGTGGGTGATFADGSHTHGSGSMDVTGNTASGGSAATSDPSTPNTADSSHMPLMRAYVFVRKS